MFFPRLRVLDCAAVLQLGREELYKLLGSFLPFSHIVSGRLDPGERDLWECAPVSCFLRASS
jgi:hypothetical protein